MYENYYLDKEQTIPFANNTYSEEKWKRAADAAREVIDLAEAGSAGLGLFVADTEDNIYYEGIGANPNYNPFKSYYTLFNNGWNPEIIFGSIDSGANGTRYT